jgi:hypothetical protein
MFEQKQTFMLHLLTATTNTLWWMFGWALLMTFWLGLICYPWRLSAHIYRVFLKAKLPEMPEEIPLLVRFQHDGSENILPPLRRSLDCPEGGSGLASQVTRPHTNGLLPTYWSNIKALIYTSPVDSEEDLIARIVEAASWHCWVLVSLCCSVIGCISKVSGHKFVHQL